MEKNLKNCHIISKNDKMVYSSKPIVTEPTPDKNPVEYSMCAINSKYIYFTGGFSKIDWDFDYLT